MNADAEPPKLEEDDDDIPELEEQDPAADAAAGEPVAGSADEPKKVLNRSEKKARKMMQRLGLRTVAGIERVTIKTGRTGVFVITNPDVYQTNEPGAAGKHPTYVVFGEAKQGGGVGAGAGGEDASAAAAAAAAGLRQPVAPETDAVPEVPAAEAAAGGEAAEEAIDETGVSSKDVDLVMSQASCSRAKAVKALKDNDGDLVNAIMSLTT
uniref:NAC-A/B domain-containing protein n=1 Tax=Helicotheca tamesis TaxID=374047 RepID=A0A7S2H6F0_9STRA